MLDDRPPPRPEPLLDPVQRLVTDERDAHHLAVHAELELLRRSVADSNRLGAFVAGQLVELELGQPAFAADPVHDLDLRRVARPDP